MKHETNHTVCYVQIKERVTTCVYEYLEDLL